MNILHVIPGLTWERGGPTAVVKALASHQAKAGHRVVVLTTDQGARNGERFTEINGESSRNGAAVEVQKLAVRGPDRLAYAPGFSETVRARLRAADIVHVHSIFTYPVHATLREATTVGVPTIVRPCGLLHRYSLQRSRWQKAVYLRLWGRMVRRACTAWHFTSANEAEQSWPWDAEHGFIVPNGIEPAEYAVDPDEARKQVRQTFRELGESAYVLFLGRLHRKKRLDVLLQAFLQGAPDEFKLVVAGPDEEHLWDRLASQWLDDPKDARRVIRVGMVTGERKTFLMAGASLFALPSEHENFGIAPLEALAAGTPVLLSPQVDFAEAAVAAGAGRTAPVAVAPWRESLASVLSDSDALHRMANRAQCFAAKQYSWDMLSARVIEHYHNIRAGRCLMC